MSIQEERFVILVSKYEELYDLENPNYSNNEVKDNIWKHIAQEMGCTASQCKDTWKKLRGNFRKAIKNRGTKSGDPAKKLRPWKLEHQIAFLLPHMAEKSQISSLEAKEEGGETSEEDSHSNISSPPSTPPTPSTVTTPASKSKKLSKPNVADVLQNYLNRKKTSHKKETRCSSLRSFFLSMAEVTENLPVHLQIQVKSKVFKAVTEAELAGLSQLEQYNNRVSYPLQSQPCTQTSDQNFANVPPIHFTSASLSSSQLIYQNYAIASTSRQSQFHPLHRYPTNGENSGSEPY